MDVATRQHVGELVTNQFADAELALRAACGLIALVMTWHFPTTVMRGRVPSISFLSAVRLSSELPG
jgi:hypothetical protein